MEPTSEQELKQLLDEGRISEEEYQQLKEAMKQRLPEDDHHPKNMSAGELALRKKMLIFSLVCCVMGLPAGLILKIPFVWILSIIGIVVDLVNMKRYGII